MTRLVLPLLLLGLLAIAPREALATGDDWQGAQAEGELVREGGRLRYELHGEVCWERTVADARPYKIVSEGALPLVVSLEGLLTISWAATEAPRVYPAMLPHNVAPPLYALSELSPGAIYALPRTLLLDSTGLPLIDAANSELLLPALCGSGSACTESVLIAGSSSDADALYVYGSAPQLARHQLVTGTELWRRSLAVQAPVADIELLAAADDRLLLLVLYDYEWAEFVLLDGKGEHIASLPLAGQVASNLVYPGPAEETAELSLSASALEILVILSSGSFERWSIALFDGALTAEPAQIPASRLREENPLPRGGSGSPGPGRAPFPQGLLPEQSGENWRMPALRDNCGRVFVIDGAVAQWL